MADWTDDETLSRDAILAKLAGLKKVDVTGPSSGFALSAVQINITDSFARPEQGVRTKVA